METLLDVVAVEARSGYSLFLEFENGEQRLLDMTPFLTRKPFSRLLSETLFRKARVEEGTVVWPGGLDIAPETLYHRSVPA